jgi:hypothetical protein
MSYQNKISDDSWAGFSPEEPSGRNPWLWLVAGLAGLAALCLCAAGGFFVVRTLQPATTPRPTLSVPTLAGQVTSPAASPEPAATVTLASDVMSPAPGMTPVATVPPAASGAVEAVRLAAPPVIDGLLNEWSAVQGTVSAFRVYNVANWDGSEDLVATWRLAWDADHLYVAVEVIDDTHVQTASGNQIFRGDSLDLQFDTDRPGDYGPTLSPDDFQITLSPGDFAGLPPSAFRFQGTSQGQILDAPGGHHVVLAAVKTADGYTLEAAIPWSDLNLQPVAGLIIGLALNASDNDTPGTAVQEVMMSHVSTRTLSNPTTWGTLILK